MQLVLWPTAKTHCQYGFFWWYFMLQIHGNMCLKVGAAGDVHRAISQLRRNKSNSTSGSLGTLSGDEILGILFGHWPVQIYRHTWNGWTRFLDAVSGRGFWSLTTFLSLCAAVCWLRAAVSPPPALSTEKMGDGARQSRKDVHRSSHRSSHR